MSPKRVLILGTSLSGGGAEYVTSVMMRVIENSSGILFENRAEIDTLNSRCSQINNFIPKNWLTKFFINIYRGFYIQLRKLMLRPAVTISHLEGPNFINLMTVAGGFRVVFIHNLLSKNYHENRLRNKLKKLLAFLLYRRADIVVGVSTEICSELISTYHVSDDRVLCLQNPIDISDIDNRSRHRVNDWKRLIIDEQYILSVASFTDQKNHKLLVDVYRQALNIGVDSRLLMVGDGATKSHIFDYCRTLGIATIDLTVDPFSPEAKILFVGHQENPYPFYLGARLLLMTSLWEGLPVSLLEAFSFGVPAIVSNCSSGIRSLFDETDLSAEMSENHQLKMTRYGYLMYEFGTEYDEITTKVWAESIKNIFRDDVYHASCVVATKLKAATFDISEIMTIWEREFGVICRKSMAR